MALFFYEKGLDFILMKIDFLKKLVGKIQHEIHCPKCKNTFKEGGIEVQSMNDQQLEFASHCHICGANVKIVADINVGMAKNLPKTQKQESPSSDNFISHKKIETISKGLKSFKGDNLQDLFQ